MSSRHYSKLIVGTKSMQAIAAGMEAGKWDSEMDMGFIMDKDCTRNKLKGRMIWTKICVQKNLDPESLEVEEKPYNQLKSFKFEINMTQGLVSVIGSRTDMNVLFTAVDQMPDVGIARDMLNLNLEGYMDDLLKKYKKMSVTTVNIKDYLTHGAKISMLTTATFKILDPQDEFRVLEKYKDQLNKVSVKIPCADGLAKMSISRQGSVSFGGEYTDEILAQFRSLLCDWHEAEVETTEVHAPAAPEEELVGAR